MQIHESKLEEILVVEPVGHLDATTSPQLEACLQAHLAGGQRHFVLDLGQIAYVSSSGLRVFLVLARQLRPRGGAVVFCTLQSHVSEVFAIAGFDRILTIAPSRDEALDKLQ